MRQDQRPQEAEAKISANELQKAVEYLQKAYDRAKESKII